MTCCWGVVIYISITTGAGVGGVTLLSAGGLGDGCGVAVGMGSGGDIIGGTHGIFLVEFLGVIFIVTVVVGEGRGALQEITVTGHAGVPGGVGIIIEIFHLDDVPAVGAAVTGTADETGIHTQLQSQTVQQERITLAYGGAVDQRGVGRKLMQISLIIQMVIIVGDIGADIVVDCLDLLIVRLLVHIQFLQKLFDSAVNRLLFNGGGVVGERVGDVEIIAAVSARVHGFDVDAPHCHLR